MIPYYIQKKDIECKEKEEKKEKEDEKFSKFSKFSSNSLVSKTRECLSSCCIIDRTISLKFHKFKTFRTDLKELIFDDIKTYNLSIAEVEKYAEAVKKIDQDANIENIKNTQISVDQSGFSLEVAKELGLDYLKGNYIIVSNNQKDCDNIRHKSFANFIKELFDSYDKIIDQILLGEALIGRISLFDKNASSLFGIMVNNPESIFNIDINFDTPTEALSKLKIIKKEEEKLLRNVKLLKNKKFLKNLIDKIEDVSTRHGSFRRIFERIPVSDIVLKNKFDYYKLDFDNLDIYCIRSPKKTIFIYFDSNGSSLNENYIRDSSIILNGKRIESINALIDMEIACYNPYIGLERAINMIVMKRKEKLYKFLEKNPESSKDIKDFLLEKIMMEEEIPENAKSLLLAIGSLIENGRDKNYFYTLEKSKIYMVYPLVQNKILYEILFRMENDEIKSNYSEKNIEKISQMGNDELRNYLTELIYHLEFNEENNLIINSWLKDNRKEICEDIGIKFIKNER